MTDVGPQPLTRPQPSWWQRWGTVAVVMIVTVPLALTAALGGWLMLHPFMDADPILDWGNGLWILSAGLLGVGVAAPPGPARRARLVIGAALAVVWFVVGRFVLFSQ